MMRKRAADSMNNKARWSRQSQVLFRKGVICLKLFLTTSILSSPATLSSSPNRAYDKYAFIPIFDRVCGNNGVEHRLAKANYPWGDGQVERMRRAIKKVAVKRDVYFSHGQLITSMYGFRMTCNFAKLLKILNGLYALWIHLQNMGKGDRTF